MEKYLATPSDPVLSNSPFFTSTIRRAASDLPGAPIAPSGSTLRQIRMPSLD
jgi:hypothetical protein